MRFVFGCGPTQAFIDVWTNERLLNIMEQLVGPEVAGHPVWNLRVKTPNNDMTTVPWHQGMSSIALAYSRSTPLSQ